MESSSLNVAAPQATRVMQLQNELLPAITDALAWVRGTMMPSADGTLGVWERVRINLNEIQYWVRPDCTSEAARAFHLAGQSPVGMGDPVLVRNLLACVLSRQLPSGAFPFYQYTPPDPTMVDTVAGGAGLWPNDNGKILGVLTELAPIYGDLGLEAAAVRLGDYFLANQRPEGWWNLDGTDYPGSCFVAWPVAGLARLWVLTGQERFRSAALRGLEYLQALQLPNGRLRTSYEINKVENWRPVSSETAIALLAFTQTQESLQIDLSAQMRACSDFIGELTNSDGAICNCDDSCREASEQDNAELADMVYTNGYALMALAKAAQVTGETHFAEAASALARFLARIRCQGESPLWDGAWRGSYDVAARQWSGRADQHNDLDEGGMYSVYTGWCTLPIVAGMLMTLEHLTPRDEAK